VLLIKRHHAYEAYSSYSYVDDLSVKKQDKALIHAKRARNIRTVLLDPKDTTVESAQFRYELSLFLFI
jgi:hypothetical protein